ncbi:MAG: hypothetical protein KDC38_17250, partial [Planctomycetes bacterium]|nr:hypothetical protein [Planctomycetota bacterium]
VISSSLIGSHGERSTGSIRHDLFFRLSGARFVLPPLRERGEDIALLSRLFYDRYRGDDDPEWVAAEIEAAILAYHWPGNCRELDNFFRRVVALGAETIDVHRFEEITGFRAIEPEVNGPRNVGTDIRSVVERAEREAILRALRENDGNKSLAARALGLSRKTLYRRMEKHGIPL